MDLKEIGMKGVECIYTGQDRDEQRVLEKAVTKPFSSTK